MRKFRKGDQVVVLTGRDKGRQGAVIRVLDDDQLIVEGINLVKRHQRPNPQAGKQGGSRHARPDKSASRREPARRYRWRGCLFRGRFRTDSDGAFDRICAVLA